MRTVERVVILGIVACFACRPSLERATAPDLKGDWTLDLEVLHRSDYPRNSMHIPTPSRSRATIRLTLVGDSLPCTERCSFVGTVAQRPESLLAPEPPDWSVDAHFAGPDSVHIYIGSGYDAGALWLEGRLRNNEVRGRWFQAFLGPGDAGRFVLTRPGVSR